MKQVAENTDYNAKENHEFMKNAENYRKFIISFLKRFIGEEKQAIDFGASDGQYASILTEDGFKITCVELDEYFRNQLQSKGLEVYEKLSDLDKQHSRIYSLDVIEHIEDDLQALKELHSKLDDDGEILIYVPAFNWLYGPLDELAGHYRRYTKQTLLPTMREAGFKIESAKYVDCIGFFASLYFKHFGSQDGVFRSDSILTYYKYIFPVSRFFDRIFQPFFGKNLLVRATKNK